jgi:tRNA threonylcarbamoyladenosine biosynthesis protein TsaB
LIRHCDDRAISVEQLAVELNAYTEPLIIGDGATLCFDYLSSAGVTCRIAPDLMRWQTAYGVALAACHTEQVRAIDLEPSYLRPSQAERELMNRG